MELPDDVLSIIRAFSQPLTRPDWRRLHIMTQADLTNELLSIDHIDLEPRCFVIQFKKIIIIFENYIFCVFRFDDYLH